MKERHGAATNADIQIGTQKGMMIEMTQKILQMFISLSCVHSSSSETQACFT
jgi:hypothetical protein